MSEYIDRTILELEILIAVDNTGLHDLSISDIALAKQLIERLSTYQENANPTQTDPFETDGKTE